MVKTAERLEFLGDIVTTAVEGGTGYWAQVSQYQYVYDGAVSVCVGEQVGDDTRAVLHEINDDETGYCDEGLVLDQAAIARGLGRIERGEVQVNTRLREGIRIANAENDAGYLDSCDADVITQAGLLNEIRYG